MTLAMTLGMSVGIRKTLWMMWGELLGVTVVAVSAVIGVSAIMLANPTLFSAMKLLGAAYLLWIGINMWQSKGKLALSDDSVQSGQVNKTTLFSQGFITAIANPKGWAFMISLLPPFINPNIDLMPQLSALIAIILISEFICMMLYATGGRTIGKVLTAQNNVKRLNQVSGTLMIMVAGWLALS